MAKTIKSGKRNNGHFLFKTEEERARFFAMNVEAGILNKTQAYLLCYPEREDVKRESLNVMAARYAKSLVDDGSMKTARVDLVARFGGEIDPDGISEIDKEGAITRLSLLCDSSDDRVKIQAIQSLEKLQQWNKKEEEGEGGRPVMYLPFREFKQAHKATMDKILEEWKALHDWRKYATFYKFLIERYNKTFIGLFKEVKGNMEE